MPPKADAPKTQSQISRLGKRFKRDFFDEIVHITVGPDKELFKMHKGLLCNASPFFSGAFEGHFVESANQCLNLPEEDPAVFKYLQLWLYSDSILEGEEMPAEISWKTLFDLYLFAESHLIPDLQNMTIDVLIDRHRALHEVPTFLIPHIYKKTSENSPIRRWIVILFARYAYLLVPDISDDQKMKLYCQGFLTAVIRELSQWRTKDFEHTFESADRRCLNHRDYHVQPQEGRVASRTAPSEDNNMPIKVAPADG